MAADDKTTEPAVPVAPPFRTRLWALFARDAPMAVILRRGPKKHYQLATWNLRRDTFTFGQWMRGYVYPCDLSPDGTKLIYWAHQYSPSAPWRRFAQHRQDDKWKPEAPQRVRNRSPRKGEKRRRIARYIERPTPDQKPLVRHNDGCWTAVSVPPYFSALAIWPSFGHWTGRGVFLNDRRIVLHESADGMTPQANVPIPARMVIEQAIKGEWPAPSAFRPEFQAPEIIRPIQDDLIAAGAVWVEWVAPRNNGELLFACDGRIYRLADWKSVPPEQFIERARLLVDFTPMRFTRLQAPTADLSW